MRHLTVIFALLAAVVGAFLLAMKPPPAAAQPPAAAELLTLRGQAFGSTYTIKIADPVADADTLAKEIRATLNEIDLQISTYRDDSELSRFNRHAGTDWFAVSPAIAELAHAAQEVSRATSGAFDVTVVPLSRLWGFGKTQHDTVPNDAAIKAAMQLIGFEKLETRGNPAALRKLVPYIEVDLSAVGEGHAIGRIAAMLRAHNIRNFFIELGGEIFAGGVNRDVRPWRAGIERPNSVERRLQCAVELRDMGLSTSGSYRNFREIGGRRYSHIIDPRRGAPVMHRLISVSVIDPSPLCADAFATVLMVLGPKDGLAFAQKIELAALLIEDVNGELREHATPQFERYRVK